MRVGYSRISTDVKVESMQVNIDAGVNYVQDDDDRDLFQVLKSRIFRSKCLRVSEEAHVCFFNSPV